MKLEDLLKRNHIRKDEYGAVVQIYKSIFGEDELTEGFSKCGCDGYINDMIIELKIKNIKRDE
jgi:hypothetical protein